MQIYTDICIHTRARTHTHTLNTTHSNTHASVYMHALYNQVEETLY